MEKGQLSTDAIKALDTPCCDYKQPCFARNWKLIILLYMFINNIK